MFLDLVKQNRSYRGYDHSRKITKEELEELVELTRYCAASANKQVLKFHISYEDAEVDAIQPMTKWAAKLPDLHLPYEGTAPTAFITICVDLSLAPNETAFLRDVGIAAQTILLGAAEKGLGGCMIGSFNKADLTSYLKLPENLSANLVIALGKPAEDIRIVDAADGNTDYYRDETGKVHYVPKRSLQEILI